MLKSILLSVFSLSLLVGNAQNQTNSPFSYFGLGETGGMEHATMGALGNSQITYFDSTVLNYYNPATYNSLAKGVPLFSFGVSNRLSNYSELGYKNTSFTSSLQHFALAFPVKKYFGFAFGFKPYSSKGYRSYDDTIVGGKDITYEYRGKGGTHEVFLGLSSDLLNTNKFRLSVGGNFGYIFGGAENFRMAYLTSDIPQITEETQTTTQIQGGVERKELRLNSLHYELGSYFTHKINSKNSYTLSFVLEPYQDFKSTYTKGVFYASNVYDVSTYDTLQLVASDSNGFVSNIPTMKVGLRYDLRFSTRGSKSDNIESLLSFNFQYQSQDWTQFRNDFETQGTFNSSTSMSFGVNFIPAAVTTRLSNLSYSKRMHYRLGVYQSNLPYSINSTQVKDFGMTFGLGLPFGKSGSPISTVNFGLAVGNRGIGQQDALNENYYGFNLGVTIAPSKIDRWFVKRKLN